MAKAKKLPSGNWRVNQYLGKNKDGKRQYKSFTASSKKEAEYLAAEYVLMNKTMPERKILGSLIDAYISDRENILSPTTIQGYRKIRRNNFQQLMDLSVDRIDNAILQRAVNQEAMHNSPKSVANAYGLISSVLRQNTYYRYSVTLPKKQKKKKELPEPAEIFRIIKGTDIELPCLLAMWLSFRVSEIKDFKKSDIVDGIISVNRVMVYVEKQYIVKDMAKAPGSKRSLRLPNYILSLTETVPDEQEYLVAMSGQAIYKRFSRLLEKNNMEHITFHDLRHVNASVMMMLNIPDKYAMERGDWETDTVYKNIYQQTFSRERQQVDKKIDEYFYSQIPK